MIYERFESVARNRGGACAIIDQGASTSYSDLLERATALARALSREAGVGEGDIVLGLLPNSAEFVALLLAAARLGAVLMPVEPVLTQRELAAYVNRFPIRAAVSSSAFDQERPDALEGLALERRFTIERLMHAAADGATPRLGGPYQGVLAAISTSGSTGQPKVLGRTQRGLLAGFEGLRATIGVVPGDRVLGVTPFHHAHGLATALIFCLMGGGTLVVMRRFLPRRLIEVVAEHRVTVVIGSPFIFGTVAECATDRSAFATVRAAISSGEAVPAPTARAFLDRTGVAICELYGSSEAGIVTLDGRPVPGVEIRIAGDDGQAVDAGGSGEVLVRSDRMAAGYLDEDGRWRFALRDGFYPMGDLGRIDANGTLVLEGRILRRLNIAGVKVDPVEIEQVILGRPEVAQVVISSAIGDRGLGLIRARIVLRPGHVLQRDVLVSHCRAALAEHKIPRLIEFVDAIPVNIMGKRLHET